MKAALIFATGMLVLFGCSSGPEKPVAPEKTVVAAVPEQPEEPNGTTGEADAPEPKEVRIIPPAPMPPDPDPNPRPWPIPDPGPMPEPMPDIEPYPIVPEKQIYDYVEEMPEFPGGMEAYKKFLVDNIKYPELAKEMGIEGKCYLRFVVTETGKITDVVVVKGIPGGEMCDKEARRVLRMMPDWKPGKNQGKAVSCYVTMPVAFKMN
jgi:protein TonB